MLQALGGTFSTVMNNFGIRQIGDFSNLGDLFAEVKILEIQKISRVESADRLQRRCPGKHAAAANQFDA